MTADAYRRIIAAPQLDRRDLFLSAANRLAAPVGNIEKDFWVCWTLNVLYHRLPAGGPRLLFKGGTSLSKAHGLINRFSEDIDVTVFRDDINQTASIQDLQSLSKNKRRAKLDAIRDACHEYITGPFLGAVAGALTEDTAGTGRIEVDRTDPDGQTLLVWYPTVEPASDGYVQPVVRIESGAKSALDPHRRVLIRPSYWGGATRHRSCNRGRYYHRARQNVLGQGRHRAWASALVRTAWRIAPGGPAYLAPLLRSSLPPGGCGGQGGARRYCVGGRLRGARADVFRSQRL